MSTLEGMTFRIECDRCGQRLVLASGLNAYQMDQHPSAAAEVAARSGWLLEADGGCECADCAVEDARLAKADAIDEDELLGGNDGLH
jgi:hypothetical protein